MQRTLIRALLGQLQWAYLLITKNNWIWLLKSLCRKTTGHSSRKLLRTLLENCAKQSLRSLLKSSLTECDCSETWTPPWRRMATNMATTRSMIRTEWTLRSKRARMIRAMICFWRSIRICSALSTPTMATQSEPTTICPCLMLSQTTWTLIRTPAPNTITIERVLISTTRFSTYKTNNAFLSSGTTLSSPFTDVYLPSPRSKFTETTWRVPRLRIWVWSSVYYRSVSKQLSTRSISTGRRFTQD